MLTIKRRATRIIENYPQNDLKIAFERVAPSLELLSLWMKLLCSF